MRVVDEVVRHHFRFVPVIGDDDAVRAFNGIERFASNLWFKTDVAIAERCSNTETLNRNYGNMSASLFRVIIFASQHGSDSVPMSPQCLGFGKSTTRASTLHELQYIHHTRQHITEWDVSMSSSIF